MQSLKEAFTTKNRHLVWAGIQVAQVFEVAIGTSIWTFFLRSIGTLLGCFWGWVALVAKTSNPALAALVLCLGLIPASFVQLGTDYHKVGQVTMVSMCVVALSTDSQTEEGQHSSSYRRLLWQLPTHLAHRIEFRKRQWKNSFKTDILLGRRLCGNSDRAYRPPRESKNPAGRVSYHLHRSDLRNGGKRYPQH